MDGQLAPLNSLRPVGWIDFGLFTFSTKVPPEICYIPSKSTENSKKTFILPSDHFIIGHDCLGMHYIRVKKFLFTIWTSWVSKDAEFYVDFKHINLP
jgi:hypothetical protein